MLLRRSVTAEHGMHLGWVFRYGEVPCRAPPLREVIGRKRARYWQPGMRHRSAFAPHSLRCI